MRTTRKIGLILIGFRACAAVPDVIHTRVHYLGIHIIIMVAANYYNVNCIRTRRDIAGRCNYNNDIRTTDRFFGTEYDARHLVLPPVTPPR